MGKKKPHAYKLREASQGAPRATLNTQHAEQTSVTSTFTRNIIKFLLIFSVGFVVAIIPDLLELRNQIQNEVDDKAALDVQGPYTQPEWYSVNVEALPENLRTKYLELREDEETQQFIINSTRRSKLVLREIAHKVITTLLRPFMTKTSINGFLGRSRMFVFSRDQFTRLMAQEPGSHWRNEILLDLGAGDGTVTSVMAQFFEQTWVTEISTTMSWQLRRRGFGIAEPRSWQADHEVYDVVSCLNLLDRTDRPMTMLQDIRRVVTPGGQVVIAMVLPLTQYVEYGDENSPRELLQVNGTTFEEQLTSFVADILEPLGFEVVRFTKLPYLSEGSLDQTFYKMIDAVFVLKIT